MPQVTNTDAQLAGKTLLVAETAIASTATGLNTFAGSTSLALQPRASVFNTATQSINNATVTAVAFNSESFDVGGIHDNATNNTRLTCPSGQGGVYQISAQVTFASNATGVRIIELMFNGVSVQRLLEATPNVAASLVFNVTVMLTLSAGDFVEIGARQDSGAALNIGSATALIHNRAHICKLA